MRKHRTNKKTRRSAAKALYFIPRIWSTFLLSETDSRRSFCDPILWIPQHVLTIGMDICRKRLKSSLPKKGIMAKTCKLRTFEIERRDCQNQLNVQKEQRWEPKNEVKPKRTRALFSAGASTISMPYARPTIQARQLSSALLCLPRIARVKREQEKVHEG
jgi:hypothetical protein